MRIIRLFVLLASSLLAVDAAAQSSVTIQGSPAPVAPEVMTRDAAGQATIRAIKLKSPLEVDGQLDEAVYTEEKPFGGFLQVVPRYGEPQTERTEVWVTYDDKNTRAGRTPTGIPCGRRRLAGSTGAGRWKWPFLSSRSATAPARIKSGGIQLRRAVHRKNEWAYLTPVPKILAAAISAET